MLHPHSTSRAALFATVTLMLGLSTLSVRAQNTNNGVNSAIVAGAGNTIMAGARVSFIGAGRDNLISSNANNAVIVSGYSNTLAIGAARSVIIGGQRNLIGTNSRSSTIAGGEFNRIEGINAALGLDELMGTISGGQSNLVGSNGLAATIGGGRFNEVAAPGATVPGGFANEASGTNSFAAGSRAVASHDYSFVWGGSPDVDTTSFGTGTFAVRAPGGAQFLTSVDDNIGAQLSPSGAGWDALSDSNAKTAVTAIDHRETLAKLAALPVTQWHYKHDPQRRYIGPMAQDFRAAFGLGFDDKHISTIDTDGVTFSAIKGLLEELAEQDAALDARDRQIQALEQAVHSMRDQLEKRGL